MDNKKLSKMQKLILRTIYQDYKKRPMRKFWSDIKTVDGHIRWEPRNRWREGIQGAMKTSKLSKSLAEKLNKCEHWSKKEFTLQKQKELTKAIKQYKLGKITDAEYKLELQALNLSYYITRDSKEYKEWQTNSFKASFSRSLKRLINRGLIKNVVYKKSKYNYGVMLTPDGERIARKIKIKDCKV